MSRLNIAQDQDQAREVEAEDGKAFDVVLQDSVPELDEEAQLTLSSEEIKRALESAQDDVW